MHQSSMNCMRDFMKKYLDVNKELKIIDIGSMALNPRANEPIQYPCYRHLIKSDKWLYQGLDLGPGRNVDLIANGIYDFGVESDSYDVVISGQVLEHVEDLKQWIVEIARIIKPGGLTCIIGPWRCNFHRFPIDCWRILPDGMKWLLEDVAGLEILSISVPRRKTDDLVGIAKKKEKEKE